MMLHKAFLSMVLIGMAFGQDEQDDIEMKEETNEESPETIVGGSQLSQKDRAKRPFLVNVGQTNPTTGEQMFLCGGSVLSSSAILTAAHCLFSHNPTPWTWDPPHWIDFFRYDTTDAIGTNGLVRCSCHRDLAFITQAIRLGMLGTPFLMIKMLPSASYRLPLPLGLRQSP
jgi:hypothetical protein